MCINNNPPDFSFFWKKIWDFLLAVETGADYRNPVYINGRARMRSVEFFSKTSPHHSKAKTEIKGVPNRPVAIKNVPASPFPP